MGLYFPNSVWLQWGLILSEEAFLSLCGIVICIFYKAGIFLFCLFGRLKNKPENFQPASARQVLIKPALFHNPVFIEFILQMIGEFHKKSVVI